MMNGVMVSLSCLQVIFHKHVLLSGQSADVPDTAIALQAHNFFTI